MGTRASPLRLLAREAIVHHVQQHRPDEDADPQGVSRGELLEPNFWNGVTNLHEIRAAATRVLPDAEARAFRLQARRLDQEPSILHRWQRCRKCHQDG